MSYPLCYAVHPHTLAPENGIGHADRGGKCETQTGGRPRIKATREQYRGDVVDRRSEAVAAEEKTYASCRSD